MYLEMKEKESDLPPSTFAFFGIVDPFESLSSPLNTDISSPDFKLMKNITFLRFIALDSNDVQSTYGMCQSDFVGL